MKLAATFDHLSNAKHPAVGTMRPKSHTCKQRQGEFEASCYWQLSGLWSIIFKDALSQATSLVLAAESAFFRWLSMARQENFHVNRTARLWWSPARRSFGC